MDYIDDGLDCSLLLSCFRVFIITIHNRRRACYHAIVQESELCSNGNFLVIVAVVISPSLKEKPPALFIASLACSDFTYATIMIPFRIAAFVHVGHFCAPIALCYVYVILDVICNIASILTLLVIAADRYFAISYPYQYQDFFTNTVAHKVIISTWSLAIIWSFVGSFKWETGHEWSIAIGNTCHNDNKRYYMASSGIYLSSLSIMTVIYVKILIIAITQNKAILKSTKYNGGQNKVILSTTEQKGGENCEITHSASSSKRTWLELKSTKTLALVYGAFVICWLPSAIINAIIFFDSRQTLFLDLKNRHPGVFMFVYYAFIEVLPVLNTAMNPFIYSFSNTKLRNAFKRVVMKVIQRYSMTPCLNSLAKRLTVYFATDDILYAPT